MLVMTASHYARVISLSSCLQSIIVCRTSSTACDYYRQMVKLMAAAWLWGAEKPLPNALVIIFLLTDDLFLLEFQSDKSYFIVV